MKIFIATDHAGFELKERVKQWLEEEGYFIKDFGAYKYDKLDDYPDFIMPACRSLAKETDDVRGIIFGGSGQGEAMAANRIKGIRAIVYYGYDIKIIKLSRQHNNANVLSIGARFINDQLVFDAIRTWLQVPFEKGRHSDRINKLDKL